MDAERKHSLPIQTATNFAIRWLHDMKAWAGGCDVYTAKYVWQDYYSKKTGWTPDWDLITASYQTDQYSKPVPAAVDYILDYRTPSIPIGWTKEADGTATDPRKVWRGWQWSADGNLLGSTLGCHSNSVDLSLIRVETPVDPPEPPQDPSDKEKLALLWAAHPELHVI